MLIRCAYNVDTCYTVAELIIARHDSTEHHHIKMPTVVVYDGGNNSVSSLLCAELGTVAEAIGARVDELWPEYRCVFRVDLVIEPMNLKSKINGKRG